MITHQTKHENHCTGHPRNHQLLEGFLHNQAFGLHRGKCDPQRVTDFFTSHVSCRV